LKCGTAKCEKEARYCIIFDYVYDGDHQVVLWATESYACEEHSKPLIRTLRKSEKEFEVCDLIGGKEVVHFT